MTNPFFDSLEPRSYFAAGALDPTFGVGGVAIYQAQFPSAYLVQGAVEQSDGKIVVGTDLGIFRFNPNGSIDTSFGSGGMISMAAVGDSDSNFGSIALQPGGKLVAVVDHTGELGIRNPFESLVRLDLNRNGAVDSTFQTNSLTTAGALIRSNTALAVQRDGKIVVGTAVGSPNAQIPAVIRLNFDGAVDTSFGTFGEVLGPLPASSALAQIGGIAVRSDGTIMFVGEANLTPFTEALTSKGKLTTVKTPKPRPGTYHPTNASFNNGVVARPDGMFVSFGFDYPTGNQNVLPVPFVSFQGQATVSAVYMTSITATRANQVVIAGDIGIDKTTLISPGWQLERYLSNQQPDPTFGTGGLATIPLHEASANQGGIVQPHAIFSTADGHLVAVGNDGVGGIILARVQATSTPVREKIPPAATLVDASALTTSGPFEYFTVEYTDDVAVKASTIRGSNIVIKGPRSFGTHKSILVGTSGGNGSPIFATYAVAGPHHGLWTAADNNSYSIILQRGQVTDTSGNPAPSTFLGAFAVNIPAAATALSRAEARVIT